MCVYIKVFSLLCKMFTSSDKRVVYCCNSDSDTTSGHKTNTFMNPNLTWANKSEYEEIYSSTTFMGQIAKVGFISRHTGNIHNSSLKSLSDILMS